MVAEDKFFYCVGHVMDFDSEMQEIESQEFIGIKNANQILDAILEVETEFMTLFLAYADLNNTILSAASEFSVFGFSPSVASFQTSLVVGAKLDFCLAMFRRYVDRIAVQADRSTDQNMASARLKFYLSKIYNSSEEYRLLYDLRNYAMHRSTAAQNLIYSCQTDEISRQKFLKVQVTIEVRKLLLWHEGSDKDKKRLSKCVLSDVSSKDSNQKISLMDYFRQVLPLIIEIHNYFRDVTRISESNSFELLTKISADWQIKNPDRESDKQELHVRKTIKNSGETVAELQLFSFYSAQLDEIRRQTAMISNMGPIQIRT